MAQTRTTTERLKVSFQAHPAWDVHRRSAAIGVPVAVIRSFSPTKSPPVNGENTKTKGKTLQQFRAQFDVRERIRAGLKAHLVNIYMLDQDFREACGVVSQDWRRFADLEEFAIYRWRFRGLLYWAAPKVLEQMKETVGAV